MSAPRMFPIQSSRKYKKPHPTSIPWSVADEAYSVYSAKCGRDQSLERLAERGGFSPEEMDALRPGWIEASSELARLRASNAALVEALQKCASWLLDRCDCVDDCGCVPLAARAALADAQKAVKP